MSTVRESFREAIATQNWGNICTVYEAITGETAPDIAVSVPPPVIDDILNQTLEVSVPLNPLDQPMEDADYDEPNETYEEYVARGGGDLITPEVATNIVTSTTIPDIFPVIPPPSSDDPASEFYIEHGSQQGGTNEDGETQCRKESIQIQQRDNRFKDNGKAFADEKVTTHPEDPHLGVPADKMRSRGLIRDKELGVDTGTFVPVVCSLCGKKESVSSKLSVSFHKDPQHNTYKCNSCSTPNGRAKIMRKQRNEQLNSNAPRRGKDTNTNV